MKRKGGVKIMVLNKRYAVLKSILVEKNISQTKLADAIGMDRSTFNIKINRHQGRDFTLQEALKISKYLNVSIDDFF